MLLLFLITIKVSAIGIYLHDCQDDENTDVCEVCESAIYNQNIEFSPIDEFHNLEIDHTTIFYYLENHYKSIFTKILFNNKVFYGRPPPSLG